MGRFTYQDLYSGQLFIHGHGCALLDPEPHMIGTESRPNLRGAYEEGVRTGDVGLIGKSGDFKSIFNIFKPRDDPINTIFGVPPRFEPLPFYDNHFSSQNLYHQSKTWVCSKKAQSTVLDVDGEAVSVLFGPGLGIQFQFSQSQGAALFLPVGARRIDYTAPNTIHTYIEKNAVLWYQFVNDLDLGAYNGSLYLVTGYDRTSCYQNLAFSGSFFQSSLSFRFSSALLPTGNVGVSLSHSSLPSDQRWLGASDPEHTLNNLSPFIRGFKIMIKPHLIPSLKLLVSISDVATSELLSKRRQGIPSLPPCDVVSPPAVPNSSSLTMGEDSACDPLNSVRASFDSDSETESDEAILQPYHPSDIINAYILDKHPDALVAITHDDEWAAILEETDHQFPDKIALISRMMRRLPFKFEQGDSLDTAAESRHVEGQGVATSRHVQPTLVVNIKHAGRTLSVQLDPKLPPIAFKEAIYKVTGVPVERLKIIVRGGVLKDDSNWADITPKAGQTFTVIGTAERLPEPPQKPVIFPEDVGDEELAGELMPVGLVNLGNTCYMNATVQILRSIPELQISLGVPPSKAFISTSPSTPLPLALRSLYTNMTWTTDAINPSAFLNVLREINLQFVALGPQIAVRDRSRKLPVMTAGFSQQDAAECYFTIVNALREIDVPDALVPASADSEGRKKFIDQYMMGEIRRELVSRETPEEAPSVSTEKFLTIECKISETTNHMHSGIILALNSALEKLSPTLGRAAMYTETSRLKRLPTYLTVHMARFAWKSDVWQKAKILRNVKFPTTYDALDLVTPELKAKLLPVNRRLQQIEMERAERREKRNSVACPFRSSAAAASTSAVSTITPSTIKDGFGLEPVANKLYEESLYREKERIELEALADAEIKADIGASWTGLYELIAIITHRGPAADCGHYIGFVKKNVFSTPPLTFYNGPPASSASTDNLSSAPSNDANHTTPSTSAAHTKQTDLSAYGDDEDWYKFDDDKVSIFPREKLATLEGGGEVAYVLLYRSKSA